MESTGGSLMSALKQAKRDDGRPEFTVAVAMSVIVFFALCLQCDSTLAIMAREAGMNGDDFFNQMRTKSRQRRSLT